MGVRVASTVATAWEIGAIARHSIACYSSPDNRSPLPPPCRPRYSYGCSAGNSAFPVASMSVSQSLPTDPYRPAGILSDHLGLSDSLCPLYPPFYAICTSSMPFVPPLSMPFVRLLCHLYPLFYAICTSSMPFVPPFSMPFVRLLCHLYTLLCHLYVIYMPGPSRPSRGTLQCSTRTVPVPYPSIYPYSTVQYSTGRRGESHESNSPLDSQQPAAASADLQY